MRTTKNPPVTAGLGKRRFGSFFRYPFFGRAASIPGDQRHHQSWAIRTFILFSMLCGRGLVNRSLEEIAEALPEQAIARVGSEQLRQDL